jgi:TPR repeat protein
VGGVSWYFLSGASVNICKTFGVCVAICLLPLGGCSENKDSRTRDMRNFDRTLERANAGDAMAQYDLGVMYSSGTGVQEDQTEAVKWYRMAAEQGDADAQHNLGVMYDNGAGVPEDDVEAYAWFSVVATGGQIRGEKFRDSVKEQLTAEQLAEAQKRATELFEKYGSGK